MIPFYAPHEYLRHKAQEHFYATHPGSFEQPDKTHGFRSRSSQDGSRHHECQENFSLAILQTCRQIYHEVKDVLYFSNTFSFRNPPALPLFASSLLKSSANPRFATRSLHLSIQLRHGSDHDEWNIAIRHIPIYIRTVQSLCINLNLDIADPDYLVIQYSAIMSSTFHLVGEPYQLRFLPLKTLVVIVADEDWAVTRRREERFSTLEDESPETGTCEKVHHLCRE
ncbi:hypothetical protein HO173_008043 [Letharia columbiana]|uniref:DUF7730 domain-containing protein n=1 Tax=Letharia columbiana TaxID=112416 RepID=A0A8H6L381_9LECA|nr:uncharacterized protein HO173_008043 [Letharia columbiana]KAF6233831.1 hypothetical protein HO173_008043 [Letharia columbiana]